MSKTRIIAAVCLSCLLLTLPAFGKAVSKHNPYERAITTARSEIWKAINGGRCGSATAAILVDGKQVGTQKLDNNAPGRLFAVEYKLPAEAAAAGSAVVRFQAAAKDQIAGGVFGLTVLRGE